MIKQLLTRSVFLLLPFFMAGQAKTYLCMQPGMPVHIDGSLDEWHSALWSDPFVDITGDAALEPPLQTRVKMMWDSTNLYIAAEMQEPHLWGTITERDRVIYVDNDIEVFIDPDGDTHNYAEIEINTLGTVWDLFLTRPYRDGTTPLNSFDIHGFDHAVALHGSINDPSDTDSCWVVEMAIPWSSLTDLTPGKRKPFDGEFWRINFSRVQWELQVSDGTYLKKNMPENNWVWSPQGQVNMHMPEHWGYVFFSVKRAGEKADEPAVPDEDLVKMGLRSMYHAQKAYRRQNKSFASQYKDLEPFLHGMHENADDLEISATGQQYLISCSGANGTKWFIDQHGRVWKEKELKAWVWMHGDRELSGQQWAERFAKLKEYGIDGVLLGGGREVLEKAAPQAREAGIELQAWTWMLNCNNKTVIADHPEWYSVNRESYSCLEKQPYVGYYKWLCPSEEGVKQYLAEMAAEISGIEGVSGFHMDYIRHPDVILPVALWPKYGLVQDHEMPEYDYCYCQRCRSDFRSAYAYDPLEISDPTQDTNWRKFRYDIVSDVVKAVKKAVDTKGKKLSAAVFPSPGIARRLVRQDWDHWPLDEVFPMVYHNFYNEDIGWIGETTWEGVKALPGSIPLYTGLYIPALSPEELNVAIRNALHAGASGICLFEYGAMTDEHWIVVWKRMARH